MLTKTRLAVVLTFTFFVFLLFNYQYDAVPHLSAALPRIPVPVPLRPTDFASKPKIAKISMLYGDHPKPAYVRALRSHRLHNERFNYAMYVLEEDALGGFWNKPTYLLSLIMQELSKPPPERLEWLMWVDADLILVNPGVPLEVFLPPPDMDEIQFLGGRDQNGLNTGTFFLRVSSWSVHMLTKALALPLNHPEIDLGNSMDQVAMAKIMGADYGTYEAEQKHPKNDRGEEETPSERKKRLAKCGRPYLFQPREWYNTYEFDHGYEGGPSTNGHLLVHFPGMEDRRWKHMDKWLTDLNLNQAAWDVPTNMSVYGTEVPRHWRLVRESRALVRRANETLADMDHASPDARTLRDAANKAEHWLTGTYAETGPGTDLFKLMNEAIKPLRAALPSPTSEQAEEDDEIMKLEQNELARQSKFDGLY